MLPGREKSYNDATDFPEISLPAITAMLACTEGNISPSLRAFGEAAAVADRAAPFMFDRAAAFGAGADEDGLCVVLAAVAVALGPFLHVPLKRLCYGIGAGGDLAAVRPGL